MRSDSPSVELVQIGDTPAMALCSLCPEPGHCCKKFQLSTSEGHVTFWKRDDWRRSAEEWLRDRGLPFRPLTIDWEFQVEDANSPDYGRDYVTLFYYCPKLSKDGRCTIYPFRPGTCRSFVPGSDALCVLHGVV